MVPTCTALDPQACAGRTGGKGGGHRRGAHFATPVVHARLPPVPRMGLGPSTQVSLMSKQDTDTREVRASPASHDCSVPHSERGSGEVVRVVLICGQQARPLPAAAPTPRTPPLRASTPSGCSPAPPHSCLTDETVHVQQEREGIWFFSLLTSLGQLRSPGSRCFSISG